MANKHDATRGAQNGLESITKTVEFHKGAVIRGGQAARVSVSVQTHTGNYANRTSRNPKSKCPHSRSTIRFEGKTKDYAIYRDCDYKISSSQNCRRIHELS